MNSLFKLTRKRILFLVFVLFMALLLIANIGIQIVNNYYSKQIIANEDKEIIELYMHIREYDSKEAAVIYLEHYSHVSDIYVKLVEDDVVIFESTEAAIKPITYQRMTGDQIIHFTIDNSSNQILFIREDEEYFINIIVIVSYSLALLYYISSRRRRNLKTLKDIKNIQELLEKKTTNNEHFHFSEFQDIYNDVSNNLRTIDVLNEKRKDNLNGLVHDLKTPITIIKYHLEESEDPTYFTENKDAIIKSLNDLSSIASDLIDENFQGTHNKRNISNLLKQELEKYEQTFQTKDISLKSKILDNVVVRFNKRDFVRVIQNLLTNAFYYSYTNTTVYVNLINNKDSYSLEVVNSGEQIPDEVLADIFTKTKKSSNNSQSNGLGLYITKLLVEDAGATISAKSDEDGNRFTITIPKT